MFWACLHKSMTSNKRQSSCGQLSCPQLEVALKPPLDHQNKGWCKSKILVSDLSMLKRGKMNIQNSSVCHLLEVRSTLTLYGKWKVLPLCAQHPGTILLVADVLNMSDL